MDLSQTVYIIAVPGQLDYLAVSFSKLIERLCIYPCIQTTRLTEMRLSLTSILIYFQDDV